MSCYGSIRAKQGNKKMITIEKFDSKNTATTEELKCMKKQAIETAINISFNYCKVILQIGSKWNEHENGELVSWSYPNAIA